MKDRKRAKYLLPVVQQMILNKQALSERLPDSKKPQATPLGTGDIAAPAAQPSVDSVDKITVETPEAPLPDPHAHFEIDIADFLNVIDAGILKEYVLRGLVKSALILAPSSLINQWKEELKSKFDLDVAQLIVTILYRKVTRTLPVFYNPVTRRIDPLVCESCKKTTRRIFLQDGKTNFVLVCPECSRA